MAWITVGDRKDKLIGLFDCRLESLDEDLYPDFYDTCFDSRQDELEDQHPFEPKSTYPHSAIELATVATHYINCYRIHSKAYFYYGADYSQNWGDPDRKRKLSERYSPVGTVGYYFGLTLDAAFDEVYYYCKGDIDTEKYMILTIDCFFDNVFYMMPYGVLNAVWKIVGLEPVSPMDMYLQIMDPYTGNEITDKIGLWARQQGFDGLIYPSARYGQKTDMERAKNTGSLIVPVLNSVHLGTPLCQHNLLSASFFPGFTQYVEKKKRSKKSEAVFYVYAEPNLVLFSNSQLRGSDRAVFYRTFPVGMTDLVESLDPRLQSKNYTKISGIDVWS
jgi:hypothetical protein